MGLNLKYLIGPPKEMLDALSECDYSKLSCLIEKEADFSLHLQPKDLQMLSDCATQYTSQFLKPFREALVCYFDEVDRGFFLVNDDWVNAIATINISDIKGLTVKWFEQMSKNYPNEHIGQPTAAAEKAVYELISLCKYAIQFEKPVIHIWIA